MNQNVATFPANAPDENPFIAISVSARIALALYFLFWRILPLCAQLTAPLDAALGVFALTILLDILVQCLLVAPMLVGVFLGSRIGWLHPLVLPALVSIALGFLKNPQVLLSPLTGWFADYREITHELYSGFPPEALYGAQLMESAMTLLAILCLYGGFAVFRLTQRPVVPRDAHFGPVRFFALYLLFLAVVMFFLQQQGGILNHMTSFASGRFAFREVSGPFLILVEFLPYMLILWYLYRPGSLRNPVFIALFAMACILQFVVTGSRSGMFVPLASLLAAWMMVSRKVPAVQAMLLGLLAVLLLGVLGEIRRSGRDGEVDLSALLQFDVNEARELTEAELEGRSRGASVAVFIAVPTQVDHLWGRTYVAALAFWVPRLVWRDKPRSAGAHTAAMIYSGQQSPVGYTGGGIPPGGVAEAYWNFSVPGVVLVYGLFGMFLRFISDWFARAPRDAVRRIVLLVALFQFPDPSTIKIVNMLQTSTMIFVILALTRVPGPQATEGGQQEMST